MGQKSKAPDEDIELGVKDVNEETKHANPWTTTATVHIHGVGGAEERFQNKRLRRLVPKMKAPLPPPEALDDAADIPLAHANLFSRLTFRWLSPLMRLGFKRPLQVTDLWRMDPSRQADNLSEVFLTNLERRKKQAAEKRAKNPNAQPGRLRRVGWSVKALRPLGKSYEAFGPSGTRDERLAALEAEWRAQSKTEYSLIWALFDTFPGIWAAAPYKLLSDACGVVLPLLIKELIKFSQYMSVTSPQPSVGKGIGLAVGLAVIELIMFTSLEQFIFLAMHEGAMMRGTLTTAMYKRGVRLTPRSKAQNSTGKLMTHLSADISRIDTCAQFIHHAWASPLRLIVTVILCCVQIGPAGLVGFIAILLAVPAQAWIMKKAMSLRKRSMEYTEGRTKLFQGLLAAMSTIKMFTYEVPYMQRITELRRKEMGGIRNLAFIRSFNEAIAFSLPTIASVFAFVMYSALHRDMNLAVIFPALSYFNMMTAPLFLLPRAMSSITDALNASRRLATLLDSEVMEDTERVIDRNLGVALRVTNASFEWEEVADASETSDTTEPFAIRNLDLVIPHGQLIAIVGPVGSGKSSLLQGLLGEMRCTEGTVEFGGRLGYCQQTAWIQNATIRDNVLFGQTWDEDRYWRCIEEASLLPDLEILADGDLTEIGEKGVNLSGGQKQRVNIARGLYYGADILLLDDPLSAVDAHVGKALFNDAILGLRNAGKTVILVTHALHFLPQVDYIYTMENGRIVEQGNYSELVVADGEFKSLMDEFGGQSGGTEKESRDITDDETIKVVDDEIVTSGKSAAYRAKAAGSGKLEGRLMVQEERKTGAVGWAVYKAFLKSGNPLWMLGACIMGALFQGSQIMSTVWITYWSENKFHRGLPFYQGLYGMLGITTAIFIMLTGMSMTMLCVKAARVLYAGALQHVFFSPMSFFDTTPQGRILGVFGKDVDVLDNNLLEEWRGFALVICMMIGAVVLITINFPYFIAIIVVVGFAYAFFAWYYRNSSREIKRLDSMLRGLLYSHFSESFNGLATIRAYGETKRFVKENSDYVDLENRAFLLSVADQRWLAARLDWCGVFLILAVALWCGAGGGGIGPGQVALCLTYMVQTSTMLSNIAQLSTMLENDMNAVERITHYSDGHLPQEAAYKVPTTKAWPTAGAIEFNNAVMSYRPALPPVLKGVSVSIASGQRVGIVGRTGAGKTSITVALYRLAELSSGTITIDGTDISTLGLRDLRANIAIIPQDPVLFAGTLRSNLDPFGSADDATLHDAIQRAHLPPRFSLDMAIDDAGANLSVGQRSLVSLARALVKDSRIMVLDEATAAVDLETDGKIQAAIRRECARSKRTVLGIAHRLRTVIGWDKILVMDAGEVREFASPLELFDAGGIFRSMCDRSGIARAEIARASEEERIG